MQSVRIGYNPGSLLSIKEVLLFSKLADRSMDVDSLWVPESWGREAFSTLGAISQITNRVRIGTSVVAHLLGRRRLWQWQQLR